MKKEVKEKEKLKDFIGFLFITFIFLGQFIMVYWSIYDSISNPYFYNNDGVYRLDNAGINDINYTFHSIDIINTNELELENYTLRNIENNSGILSPKYNQFYRSWNGSYYGLTDKHYNNFIESIPTNYLYASFSTVFSESQYDYYSYLYYCFTDTAQHGIQSIDYTYLEGNRNFSWSTLFSYDGFPANYECKIYFHDESGLVINVIYFKYITSTQLELQYYDGSYHHLDYIDNFKDKKIDCKLNYDTTSNPILTLYVDGVYFDTYTFTRYYEPSQIKYIRILNKDPVVDGNTGLMKLYYFGILDDGQWIDAEYGQIVYQTQYPNFITYRDLYYSANSSSTYEFDIIAEKYNPRDCIRLKEINQSISTQCLYGLVSEIGSSEIITDSLNNIHIILGFLSDVNLSDIYDKFHLTIHGIYLYLNDNPLDLTLTTSNIDLNDTYLYVSSNRLYYNINFSHTTNLEYLSLEFDIVDIQTLNRTIKFTHKKINEFFFTEVRAIYSDDTYTYYESQTNSMTTNSILPQNKLISKFEILITDNNMSYIGSYSGYVSDIILVYYPNIELTITTMNFFAIIPSILVIIIIPYLVSIRTKLRFLFLPLIFIMSIISMAGGLIPVWFGVIICMFVIAYYIINKKFGGD